MVPMKKETESCIFKGNLVQTYVYIQLYVVCSCEVHYIVFCSAVEYNSSVFYSCVGYSTVGFILQWSTISSNYLIMYSVAT